MATTSTLSSFSRTPTPLSKYLTADEGASNPGPEDVTDISSPGEAVDGAGDNDFSVKTLYHAALNLPEELKSRVQIHLEEQTYAAALNLLASLLCDNIPRAHASSQPVQVPPPAQLAVVATLAIQPRHTSKLSNSAAHDIASLSLSYLRNLLATVGPVNGRLREAFVFRGDGARREGGRRRRSSDDLPSHGSESDEDHIRGRTANAGSIWVRGQDFWRVVGWAFNCSALYPHRWRWWKPWLEYMVDVLEADYEERRRLDEECSSKEEGSCKYPMLQQSLLVSYITPKNSRSSLLKPIMSALFADGSTSSTSIYTEVFKNETKIASASSKKRKRFHVDLENDNFGDYDYDSSTGGSEPPTPEHKRICARTIDGSIPWTSSALTETITLRLRLFALLSRAVDDLPKKCDIRIADLYEMFVEKMAQLPVPAFEGFIAHHSCPLEQRALIAIIRLLMPAFLPSSTPQPQKVHPEADMDESVSDRILVECYLPFAYRTAENNAKLSLAIETLFRIMWRQGCFQWTPALQRAVEEGVKARNDKSVPKKNSRKEDGESVARSTLRASGARILALAGIIKMQSTKAG